MACRNTPILSIIIHLLMVVIVYADPTFWANLTSTAQETGSTASHSYVFVLQDITYTSNSYFVIVYPSYWNVASANGGIASDYCENNCILGNVALVKTGQNVRINNLMTTAKTSIFAAIKYTLKNIVNPQVNGTDTITVYLYDNTDIQIASSSVSIITYPSKMTCSAVPANSNVSATTSYTFTITPNPNAPLPNTGHMLMSFPDHWRSSVAPPAFTYLSCSNSGSINCVVSGNDITITQLFAAAFTTSAFSFSFNEIINPGNQQINQQLGFKYYYSNGSLISFCQVPLTGLQSLYLTDFTFSYDNMAQTGILDFTTVILPINTDELFITFPPQIYINDTTRTMQALNSFSTTIDSLLFPTKNQIRFLPFVQSQLVNVKITIYNLWFIKPTKNTTNIVAQLKRNGFKYCYASCCSISLSANQSMTINAISTTTLMKATADYRISLTFTYLFPDYLLITFCSPFTLTNNTQYKCYISNTISSSLLNCTALSDSQIKASFINNSTLFSSYLGYQQSYELDLIGIVNPSQLFCSVKVETYYLPSTQLEYSNTFTINYSSVKILNVAISSSNLQVGAISTYTFNINNTNTLLANSIMHLYFPSPFTLTTYTCTINGISTSCPPTNVSNYITFTLPGVAISQYGLYSYSLAVTNVQNPPSLKPTQSFIIFLESGSNVVEGVSDGVVIAMKTLSNFNNLSIIPSNYTVGILSSYKIDFTHSLVIPTGSILALAFKFPTSFIVINCTSCSSYQTFLITNSTNTVTISNIYNPQVINEPTGIIISLLIDGYLAIQDTKPSPTFTSAILSFSLSSNSSFLGQLTNINITIISIPINSKYLIINIPPQYTIGTLTASTDGSATITFSLSSYTLNITLQSIAYYNITIILLGITNPVITPSSSWSVSVYSISGVLISSSSAIVVFIAGCGTLCKQCVSANCTSCYNNVLVNNNSFFDNNAMTCRSSCLTTQFVVNLTCFPCSSNCLTCSYFQSNCTSCGTGFNLLNWTCLALCPDTYYASSNLCNVCTNNNCKVCTSSTICLSCLNDYLLQTNNTCSLTCPVGSFNFSNICSTCPINCSQCDTNGCSSCTAPNYLILLTYKTCVPTCPQDYYISNNGSLCQLCQSPCLTCSTHSNNCTSCSNISSNKYLDNFKCLTVCSNFTYPDVLNQCFACISPCSNCASSTNCSSCLSPYLFYAPTNQCVTSCFLNTINVSNNCLPCTSPCLTCSISVTHCDSCIQQYFLYTTNFTCSLTCVYPYLAINGICSSCYLPCLTCNPANVTICLTCIAGYYLFNSNCYLNCPLHTYNNSITTCSQCSSSCYSCSLLANNCTSCYNGSSILGNVCYSPCPPTYFSYLGGCSLCEPQCLNCNHSLPFQCSSCINSSYYFNPLTYSCTLTCSHPYYIVTATSECKPCQIPCKTCSVNYDICTTCYVSKFLLNNQCIDNCPNGYYATSGNVCTNCPTFCATCDSIKCFTCQPTRYFFQGSCYATCPLNAPTPYLNFCRNCQRQSCILCNSDNQCILCFSGYLNYNGDCLAVCPDDYQPDDFTSTKCVLKPAAAYSIFIQKLQAYKVFIFPSSVILILSTVIMYFSSSKLLGFAFLLAVPQCIALVQLTYHFVMSNKLLNTSIVTFPSFLMFLIAGVHVACSIAHVYFLFNKHLQSSQFVKWSSYGSNDYRSKIVMVFSLLNKQISYLLFTGLFNLPFTSFKYQEEKRIRITHILYIVLVEVPIIVLTIFIAIPLRTLEYSNKLFYSAADAFIIFLLSFIFDIVFIKFSSEIQAPPPYTKFILPNVSGRSLPALSDPAEEIIVEEVNPNNVMHRSNSDQDMFESKEIKDIDYKSELDPEDYFDDTPHMNTAKLEEAIEKGDFRKKNKKKRGRRREGRLDLKAIDEQQEDEQDEEQQQINGKLNSLSKKKKKKKKTGYKQPKGTINNFIYWKKPTTKKLNPGKIFKQNERDIMSRIKEKQSQFDTITQNDVIFKQEYDIDEDSSFQDYNIQNESKRALQPNYDNYFNLNYAQRHHLG